MASRLNKRFALTAAAISLTAVAVPGGLGLLAYRANTTRHIKAGDQLMAKGAYEAALKEYGRAVAKEKSDLSHLRKYEQALLRIRPDEGEEVEGDLEDGCVMSYYRAGSLDDWVPGNAKSSCL